jgi:hypothetical protein
MKTILLLLALVLLFGVGYTFIAPSKCSEDDQIECTDDVHTGIFIYYVSIR